MTNPDHRSIQGLPRGLALLQDPLLNKGTAFTAGERGALGLTGLLPPHVHTMEDQVARVVANYRRKSSDLERYIHLVSLQDRNETLFYRVLTDNLEEMLPIVYTPTVGEACQQYGEIFRRARGLYLSIQERGQLEQILRAWPRRPSVIVVTDGERILGLGDQGAHGMGIPVGKLSLYTACAGIPPGETLPVLLDVGTENPQHLGDPLYLGVHQTRVRGAEYDAFVDEFVAATQEVWPGCLVQFEDFGNATAFHILERWRRRAPTFNDDIQGTAAVALAGIVSALRLTGKPLREQKIVFLGAGEAGIGIGDLIAEAMHEEGLSVSDARGRVWFVDTQGLVVKGRRNLAPHKLRYAHDAPPLPELLSVVRELRPTALIGASAQPKAFSRDVLESLAAVNERPIVFALSNPTSRSECTAEEAYRFTGGRALFASGSPMPPVELGGRRLVPGQGNNVYVFPGIGLGVLVSGARQVTDVMFAEAARTLASCTSQQDLEVGRLYPEVWRIREVSRRVAAAVAEVAFRDGLASRPRPEDLERAVAERMWEPIYPQYA